MGDRLRVGILALSPIADDPRVRRQGDALHAAGFDVVAFGQAGGRSEPPAWTIRSLDELASAPRPPGAPMTDIHSMIRHAAGVPSTPAAAKRLATYRNAWIRLKPLIAMGLRASWPLALKLRPDLARISLEDRVWYLDYYARLTAVRIDRDRAEEVYWSLTSAFTDLFNLALPYQADVWIANDWNTLPIAAQLADLQAAAYLYDTHELAHDEHTEDWVWKTFLRAPITAIEGKYIGGARAVTAVSAGITRRLETLYGLPKRPTTIRNTPKYQEVLFHPTAAAVKVLYHGIIVRGRGIEACIRSVPRWGSQFHLTLRGPLSDDYRAVLEDEIGKAGVASRVTLAPPVPMDELVSEAAAFDVGLFALPGHSKHNEFALPNKLFEYAMAGLCLCVSDMPEMESTVVEHDIGVVFRGAEPEAIAAAINSLTPERIDAYKRNALVAAKQLCWESEQARMIDLYTAALAQPPAVGPKPKMPRPAFPPATAHVAASATAGAVNCFDYWSSAGARLEAAGDGLVRIVTPEAAWHYTASVPIDLKAVDFERDYCWIRLELEQADGGAMVSLYDDTGNATHFERPIPQMDGPGEILLTPDRPIGTQLMFRNGEAEGISTVTFRAMQVLTSPR